MTRKSIIYLIVNIPLSLGLFLLLAFTSAKLLKVGLYDLTVLSIAGIILLIDILILNVLKIFNRLNILLVVLELTIVCLLIFYCMGISA